jgi:hypothetical protein
MENARNAATQFLLLTDKYNKQIRQLIFMALKDVLEDKKKKRTITIVGTIVIILVTAGVFAYEASSIEVKEPPKTETATGKTTTTPAATTAGNETGNYNYKADKTVKGSCRNPDAATAQILHLYDDTSFPVRSGAKKAVITVSSEYDIDLRIYDPDGTRADNGEGVTAETTETITLTGQQLSAGDWTARVNRYSLFSNPAGTTDYHIVIDVYYE